MATLWFKAKRYGYGWYPCSWEGWVILFIAVLGLISNSVFLGKFAYSNVYARLGTFVADVVILTLLLIICVIKGEKARWRWGN